MGSEIAFDAGSSRQRTSDLAPREIAIVLDGDTIIDASGPCEEVLRSSREELIGDSLPARLFHLAEDGHAAFEPSCAALLLDSRVFPIEIAGRVLEVLILTLAGSGRAAAADRGGSDAAGCRELLATLRDIVSDASSVQSLCDAALGAVTSGPSRPWARSLAFLLVDDATGDPRVVARRGLHFDAEDPDNPVRVPLRVGATTIGFLVVSRMDDPGVERRLEFLATIADILAAPLHRLKLEAQNAVMEERIGTLLLELQHATHVAESVSRRRIAELDDLVLDVQASIKAVVNQGEVALSGEASTSNRAAVLERLCAECDLLESVVDEMILLARSDAGTPEKLSRLHECFQCQTSGGRSLGDQQLVSPQT